MLDPASIATAVSLSTAAFNNLKKAFAMGRDIEQMSGDLSRWMNASSDIEQAVKTCKNPPFYKKMLSGDSVEEAAMKSLVAQKTLEKQRYELQQYVKFKFGVKSWEQLLKTEGLIRKQRQETLYKQAELRRTLLQVVGIVLLAIVFVGSIVGTLWMLVQRDIL